MERGAWPDSVEYWHNLRVMVTGGAGFLGRHVVAKLREHGATQIEVVDRDRYDLRQLADIRRALDECKPDIIIHPSTPPFDRLRGGLRAGSGGTRGRDRRQPGAPRRVLLRQSFGKLRTGLMMGVPLLHEAWRAGVSKFVALGTVCAYPNPSTHSGHGLRRCRFVKRICGMATPRRPTRSFDCAQDRLYGLAKKMPGSTGSPQGWCRARRIASSTVSTRSSCCR